MPGFNFMDQFTGDVETGIKRQTIRAIRKDNRVPAKAGDTLTLWNRMRRSECRKLADVTCLSVQPIRIQRQNGVPWVSVDGIPEDPTAIALADGFTDVDQMFSFFETTHGLPITGWLIKWQPQTPEIRSLSDD